MELDALYVVAVITYERLNSYVKKSSSNQQNEGLCVLHHSENFLVVNKRHDLLINTNKPNIEETLQTQLMQYCPSSANALLTHKFHFVHRLDFVTSGVLCVALNRKAAKAAGDSFINRAAKKYYLAIVRGWVKGSRLSIDLAIGEDAQELEESKRMCVASHPHCINPREAQTKLLVLQRALYDGYPATKVLLQPSTGRRHQLRVHMSYIGHTIVGDYTYSKRKDVQPPRTFLHSLRLVLPNPLEPLDVKTDDPFVCIPKWKLLETVHETTEAFSLLDEDWDEGMHIMA